MAGTNLTLTISADAAKLRAELAVAQSSMRAFQTEMNRAATAARKAGDDMSFAKVAQSAAQFEQARGQVAKLSQEVEHASKSFSGLNLATAGATRELIVLAHEMVQGNYTRLGGSLMVLSERMGGLHEIVGSVSGSFAMLAGMAAAVVVPIGYLGYEAYKSSQALRDTAASLALLGETVPTAAITKWQSELRGAFNLGISEADEVVKAFAKVAALTQEQRRRVAELAVEYAKANRLDVAKTAEEWAKAAEHGAKGLMELAKQLGVSSLEAKKLLDAGNEPGSLGRIIDDLTARIERNVGAWARAKAAFEQFIAMSGQAAGLGGTPTNPEALPFSPVQGQAPNSPGSTPGPIGAGPAMERADREIAAMMRHAGEQLRNACARLVNEALAAAGFPTSGNDLASSFHHYGRGVSADEARKGDIFYAGPSGRGDTGHVGIVLGPAQNGYVPVVSSHMSGPDGNPADAEWRRAAGLTFRRPVGADDELGRKAQQGEDEARQRDIRVAGEAFRLKEIEFRHSLENQKNAAIAHYQEIKRLAGEGTAEEAGAKQQLIQKLAQIYDEDTRNQIAALKAKQAAAQDISTKIALQQQVIGVIQGRGAERPSETSIGGGAGANPQELNAAKTELASLQRQLVQQNFQLAEEGAAAMRHANADILRGYTAQQEEAVKLSRLNPFQAIASEAARARELASANAADLNRIMEGATSVAERTKVYWQLWDEGIRAATQQQELMKRRAEEVKAVLDKWTAPVRSALDGIGSSFESALTGLLTRQKTWGQAMQQISQTATQSLISAAGSIASKIGGSVLGGKPGQGVGDVLADKAVGSIGNMVGKDLLGIGSDAAGAAALTGSATALTGAATALTSAAAALSTSAATSGGSSALGAAGNVASGGGFLNSIFGGGGGLGSLFSAGGLFGSQGAIFGTAADASIAAGGPPLALELAALPFGFQHGGIVPSAAGGWALPSFAGAQPAMLHSREMVLPAHISEGIQNAIAAGGFGSGSGPALHLHAAVMDTQGVKRLFADNGRAIADAMRSAMRSSHLTPRTI